jgi:hypothetical protein
MEELSKTLASIKIADVLPLTLVMFVMNNEKARFVVAWNAEGWQWGVELFVCSSTANPCPQIVDNFLATPYYLSILPYLLFIS